jgi:uncharacterized FlaG/YvyC family protein
MQINALTPISEFPPTSPQSFDKPEKVEKPKTEQPEFKIEKNENLEQLKNILAENKITLQFSQDSETKELVVKLVDDVTGEAIRQIPSEISLKLSAVFVKLKGQFVEGEG